MKWPWSKPEQRMVTVPFGMGDVYGSTASVSTETALTLASVYAANRLLAASVSTLPVKAYRVIGEERQPMSSLPQLFQRLRDSGQLVPWLHRCMTSLGLRGNAYGLVTARDGFGFPIDVTWLNPSDISIDDANPGAVTWRWRGRIVSNEDIVHIPWFTLPGSVQGLSPIASFATTMNVGLHAQAYGNDWFEAGGIPPGTFRNSEQVVDQADARTIKTRLVSAIKTREPIVYGRDWEYTPISVNPNEAQFIETMKMTTSQVASIYGIPPEMIGGETGSSMTYANVEQQQINFVMFTLRPWLVTLESAFSAILPDRQYVKFNADALIRADLRTRHEVYKIDREIGLHNVDELRALEDLPALPNGTGQDYAPAVQPAAATPSQDDGDNVTPMRRWAIPQ